MNYLLYFITKTMPTIGEKLGANRTAHLITSYERSNLIYGNIVKFAVIYRFAKAYLAKIVT